MIQKLLSLQPPQMLTEALKSAKIKAGINCLPLPLLLVSLILTMRFFSGLNIFIYLTKNYKPAENRIVGKNYFVLSPRLNKFYHPRSTKLLVIIRIFRIKIKTTNRKLLSNVKGILEIFQGASLYFM